MEVQKATERSCGCTDTQLKYTEFIIRLEMIGEKVKVVNEEIRGLQDNHESFSLVYDDCMNKKGHINYLQQMISKTSEQFDLEASLRREVEHMETILNDMVAHFNLLQMQLVNRIKENITDLQKLQTQVLDEELVKWKHEQQLSGNGVPMQLNLDVIQNLCELLADLIWSTRQQVLKVKRINSKIIPEMRQSHFDDMLDDINKQVTNLLSTLLNSTFVIEKQPQQVIIVNARFKASVRLLVGRPLSVHVTPPQVTVMLISEEQAQLLPKSDFANLRSKLSVGDILNNSNCMEYEPTSGKLCVHFRNMQLKKIKHAGKKGTASVTDKKLTLLFQSELNVGGGQLIFKVWTQSLPVVVVDSKQEAHGWATITWDNAFRSPGHVVPDKVSWGQLADTLRIKFRSEIGGDLTENDLLFLAEKLFSSSLPLDRMELDSDVTVTFTQFCKSALPGREFTFWEWFYRMLEITRDYFSNLWCDRLIIGFIQKKQAEEMLSNSPPGTFLLRFSDSELGGITIAWVAEGKQVVSLQPFTYKDLLLRSLADRILDLTQLQFLYPNVPKDDVFSKYYTKPENNMVSDGYVMPVLVMTLPSYMSASPSSAPSPSYVLSPSAAPSTSNASLPSSAPLPSCASSSSYAPLPSFTLSPSYAPLPSSTPPPSYTRLPSSVPLSSYVTLPSSAPSTSYVTLPSSTPPPSYTRLPSSVPSPSYVTLPSSAPSPSYVTLPSSAPSTSYVTLPSSALPPSYTCLPSSAPSPSYVTLPSSAPSPSYVTLPSSAPSPSYVTLPSSASSTSYVTLPSSAPSTSYVTLPSSAPSTSYAPLPSSTPPPSYASLHSSAPSPSYAPLPSSTPPPSYESLPSSTLPPSYAPSQESYLNMPSVNSSAATPAQTESSLIDSELVERIRAFELEDFENFNLYGGNYAMK